MGRKIITHEEIILSNQKTYLYFLMMVLKSRCFQKKDFKRAVTLCVCNIKVLVKIKVPAERARIVANSIIRLQNILEKIPVHTERNEGLDNKLIDLYNEKIYGFLKRKLENKEKELLVSIQS